jgi:hypothetical protein
LSTERGGEVVLIIGKVFYLIGNLVAIMPQADDGPVTFSAQIHYHLTGARD